MPYMQPIRTGLHLRRSPRLGLAALLLMLAAGLWGCVPIAYTPGNSTTAPAAITPRVSIPPTSTVTPAVVSLLTAANTAVPAGPPPGAVKAALVKIIDGDTIDVSFDGRTERVRYIGVDTPERSQPGFKAATGANRRLLGDGPLYLVRDVSDRDKTSSHRLLRYVYTQDGTLVERALVAGGWAQPVEYPPDTKFAEEFRQLGAEAAHKQLGFWAPTPPADGAMPYGLTTGAAEVRKGPGAAFKVSSALGKDTPLTVYGRTSAGDWLQVRTPTRTGGWVDAARVRLNVPIDQVPVPQNIPAP